ncbi:MAG: peptidoglycan bridge formation glycyltransferase FemA/FemB family protein, partial [Oscillospiraceae bacterium]
KDGNIRGSMLIFLSKVPHTKYTHMYCPRGPVVDDGDRETMAELCGEARAIAKKHNAYELSIDPDITENDKAYLSDLNAAGFVINNTKCFQIGFGRKRCRTGICGVPF